MRAFRVVEERRRERSTAFRAGQLLLGLVSWGLASTLLIRSDLGLGPWDAFHVGLSRASGLTVGLATIATGLAILVVTLLMRVRPGPATIANMILLGVFVDLLLPIVPDAPNTWMALLYFATGIGLAGVATGWYIGAGFGQGPRDALMLAIHGRTGWSVGRARTLLEALALGAGWLMGGRVGLGTILYALAVGPVVQWGLRTFGPPPQDDVDSDTSGAPRLRRAA